MISGSLIQNGILAVNAIGAAVVLVAAARSMSRRTRVGIWLLETMCIAALTVVLLVLLGLLFLRRTPWSGLSDELGSIEGLAAGVVLIFFSTGYLLTTVLFRTFLPTTKTWLYPALAVALYEIHFEILNFSAGGAWGDRAMRVWFRGGGAVIAFSCTMFGNVLLRRWGVVPTALKSSNRCPSTSVLG